MNEILTIPVGHVMNEKRDVACWRFDSKQINFYARGIFGKNFYQGRYMNSTCMWWFWGKLGTSIASRPRIFNVVVVAVAAAAAAAAM